MPFQSEAQKGFLYANKPAMAKRWQAETPKGKALPKKKKKGRKEHPLVSAMLKHPKS
jgi:hypothetical protein